MYSNAKKSRTTLTSIRWSSAMTETLIRTLNRSKSLALSKIGF